MEDDQKQRPESLLPYEKWIEEALRHVVAQAIEHVAVEGLPGGHHFYITFRTGHRGVEIPQRVRAQKHSHALQKAIAERHKWTKTPHCLP